MAESPDDMTDRELALLTWTYWAYHEGYTDGKDVETTTDAHERVIDSHWSQWADRELTGTYPEDAPTPPFVGDTDG